MHYSLYMESIRLNLLYFIIFIAIINCRAPFLSAEKIDAPLNVFVSIMPYAYFAKRICGDRISVEVLVPPGKNPSNYSPTPFQIKKLKKSKLFFRAGVPFEHSLIPKIETSGNRLKIIDTRKGIKLREIDAGHHHIKRGNHKDHMTAYGKDPHIWMDPLLAIKVAENIYHAIVNLYPEGKKEFENNFKVFTADMIALNKKISEKLAPFKGRSIFVFHPAFGYFTDAYGMKQIAVETEGKPPKGKNLSFIIKKAKKENIRVVFAQPQFDTNAAQKIAKAINGKVVFLNPLAKDYIRNLEAVTERIAEAMIRQSDCKKPD